MVQRLSLEEALGGAPKTAAAAPKRLSLEDALGIRAEKPALPAGEDLAALITPAEDQPKSERKVYTGSVFDTQPFDPKFDPVEAEKLSRRAYAEKQQGAPRRTQSVRATPADQIERSLGRAAADTGIGLLQGAAGISKGIASNINAGDNPVAEFFDKAIQAGERSKSPFLQSQNVQREALLKNVLQNQGELAQTRAAFTSMFSPSGADIIAQGSGSMLPIVGMSLLGLGQRSFVAANALANAGDAAQNTAQKLSQMSPEDWSKSDLYQELRSNGLSHADAAKMLAPLLAMPAQLAGGVVGGLSGATGLEKSLVGGAIKGGTRERAARASAEVLGEEAETLVPSAVGNITQRLIDEKKSITEGLGREAVETLFGATPAAALAASGRSAPDVPPELNTLGLAERMARERGFLTPTTRAEPPVQEKVQPSRERIEPTFEQETPAAEPSAPKQPTQESRDLTDLNDLITQLRQPAGEPTLSEPRAGDDLTQQREQEQATEPELEGKPRPPERFSYMEEAAKYDTPEMRLKQADALGDDVLGLVFGEAESYGRAALKKKSLTAGYAEKKDNRNDAADAATVAFGTGDYGVFTPYEKLFPKTAAKLKAALAPAQEVSAPDALPAQSEALGSELDQPFSIAEEMEGVPAPMQAEVEAEIKKLTADREAFAADRENLAKRTSGTSLSQVLRGTLKDAELSELGGRARQVGKNPFLNLKAPKGQAGSSMEDMVNSGKLDLFLPFEMRPGQPGYDNSDAAEYIREKLRNNQTYTYETELDIRRADIDIESIERQIQDLLSDDEINKELQYAANEQREADQAAQETAAPVEDGAAEQRAAKAPDGELDKREAQLDREEELNQREARLLEERKRLEEERLKLESPTKQDVADQEERKAKAAEADEREQIRKESEAGSGQFELTREEGRQDTTGGLFDQPEPEPVAISTEQEREEALKQFKVRLTIPILPFRAKSASKTQMLRPAPLTDAQIKEVLGLASEALDFGLPSAVLGNVYAAGSIRMDARAVMSAAGDLMLAKHWKASTPTEKLQSFIHELAHAVDTTGGNIYETAKWAKAHAELENWYTSSATKPGHPLAYPFAPQFRGRVRPKQESFAQAFAYYFVTPVDLQKNAPEAYSQIQDIVERIQDESQTARATGSTKTGTAGIKIQPTRPAKGAEVQSDSSEVGPAVGGATRLEDRGSVEVTKAPPTDSAAFKRWFGDSKVVDENGEPLVVYHGTKFSNIGAFQGNRGVAGHFAFDPAIANDFAKAANDNEQELLASGEQDVGDGGQVYPVYLKAENIFDARNPEHVARVGVGPVRDYSDLEGNAEAIRAAGFDSYYDFERDLEKLTGIAVFDPAQIKSATGNIGTYDPDDANINKSLEDDLVALVTRMADEMAQDEKKRSPSLIRTLKTYNRQRNAGKMSEGMFIMMSDAAIRADEERRLKEDPKDRERGYLHIQEKLSAAVRRGELPREGYDLANWFMRQNEDLVTDLGISIKGKGPAGSGGFYNAMSRVFTLIKDGGSDLTATHEILHHLERMMPTKVRQAIQKAWLDQLTKAAKTTKDPVQKLYFEAVLDANLGNNRHTMLNPIEGAGKAYADARMALEDMAYGNTSAKLAEMLLLQRAVPIGMYQYFNPSEFWAVNGSRIVQGRYDAVKGGALIKLKNWLREFGQKIKSLLRLNSDAPVIRALDSLVNGDGKFQADQMLSRADNYASLEGEEAPKKEELKKLGDTWLLGRDKAGNVGFGPGAKAYAAIAGITNTVLDKMAMKPVSPELGRAMRNMKARVDQVQNKIGEVAAEMNKLSKDEREMISDIIEGELKADVHPPQHVLNLAASIQSMMSRQSQELVELGMLSKEAANRWNNKYLPRFYETKLRDEVSAWAKATKDLFKKQPMMRGIKGSQLRARGLFEVIDTKDLPDYLDMGWEQRDPEFNPKTSDSTIVWRDYNRAERENMGEIRDAMFRFVMGYNASQRDIALGRLYKDLADNYASKFPLEGYVQVPETKAEGTQTPRYGKLEGLYVPKEVMDHLSANDEAMANGILKLYRAGLSKWKEGKTVLNPVSHANNVISNLTMAHFAGVSYWDAFKYAGAVKDFVTKSKMVKEAQDVGVFGGSFNNSELVKSMPPELKAMANMTESRLARFGERIWDTLAFTIEAKGTKYGARPVMQWAYEGEDMFFRYLIYRDARGRGMSPEDARDYSQEYIFTYDDLPKGARAVRDYGMPFFSYTYKVVPVLARTALVYPWRYAAPATIAYTANALMYAIAANMGGSDDDWWTTTLYRYMTDEDFRNKAKALESEERKLLPEWMKGQSAILSTPKAIRMGMDEATNLPMFLDISRIFPGGDLLDANNNSGGVALLQPLTPSNPVLTSLVAMLANRDMFLGKDVVNKKTDTDEEKAQKRAAWLWKQTTPAISVGNYHFDRAMSTIANMTGKPITIDAGPMGTVSYTGVGKDGLPIQPKHAMLQTMGIKIRPYDLELSRNIEESNKKQTIREIDLQITRINRQESKNVISSEAAQIERDKLQKKRDFASQGLTPDGKAKK